VFPDRAAAREQWREKDMFASWDQRAFDLYLAEAMADRPDGQVELKCAPETEAAIYAAGQATDVWVRVEKLAVPTLMLWARHGDFPRAVFESYASRMANARVEEVDAGHLVPMERPGVVVDAALAFAAEGQVSTG
jgi:pimeloyl-ACP methyl ester carboxylesterase